MTNEEARAYFIDCNKRIISVVKDENGYNYETKQIKDVFMRRTFEANELAIKALEHDPHETVTEFADRCSECGREKVLDKIRAEIMQLDYDTDYVDYDSNDMPQTETVHTICREEVLQIIDKSESEDKDADKKCTYKETGCGSCKWQLDCPIEADKAESEDKTWN